MYALTLNPKTMTVRLRKDAVQFSLFGDSPSVVGLTPKARRDKKQQERWATQGELFPNLTPKTFAARKPKAPKQARKPKAPRSILAPKPKDGDTKPARAKDGGTLTYREKRGWVREDIKGKTPKAPTAPSLAVLQDKPTAPTTAPTATPVAAPVPTPAVAPVPTPAVEPKTIAESVRQTMRQGRDRASQNPDNFKPEVGQQFNISGNNLKRSHGDWQVWSVKEDQVSLGRMKNGELLPPSPKNMLTVTADQLAAMMISGSAVLKNDAVPTLRPKAEQPKPMPTAQPVAPEPTPVSTPASVTPEPAIELDADFASTKRQQERIAINQQVRDLLSEKPDGPYSKDELTLLARYSGKGGIIADEGSLSEYYTRPDVAKFVTDLLYQHGFDGGTVLEPSCGNGVFLHQLKNDPNALPVGVELDSTSGAAATALNPHADVTHGVPFERFLLDNPDFVPDAVVGNVPFGTRTVEDLKAFRKVGKGWTDNGDFFVHESLSRLKAGGTMALIVPHGITTGSNHQKLRRELMKQGRVLGVYRLPNTAFKHTGTRTITDVLVIQKHPDEVLNAIAAKDKATVAATRDDRFIHGKYFEDNPQHILGKVRTIINQYGDETFTVDGDIEDALAQAQPHTPTVTYDGLDVPTMDERGPQEGDEKYVNGRLYRYEGKPLRWHRVDHEDAVSADEGADSSAYGTSSLAAAEATLQDPGQRVMIAPENLAAYARLAGAHLDPTDAAAVKETAAAVDAMGSTADKEKLAHAMLLAAHVQKMQQEGSDDSIHVEQALAMLQRYREAHGNPATDKTLTGLVGQFPVLLHLQGAFGETGEVSDYFTDHDSVMARAKRSHSEAGAAMAEAYRAAGGEAVTLDEIRQHLDTEMTDGDLAAALATDPTVGYMGGTYQPIDRLLRGNGFTLMDALMMEAESLPEGSPSRHRLEEQIGMIRARLKPREMEDITTPFWAVGSWIPADALNEFMAARGYDVKFGYDALAQEWRHVGKGGVWGTAEDVLTTMNRGRISHGQNTKEAKEAVAALEKDFGQWLSSSQYRLQVEEAYNLAFNGDLLQEFSGEPLDIPLFDQHDGVDGGRPKRLHDYQNSTIRQMAEQGRGIIALGVGLGKTATSIGLALHLKAMGRAKKPTFVVPKSVLANWVKEIGVWAPEANVMILGQTQKFWANGEPGWEVPGYKIKTKGGNPEQDKDGNYILYKQIGEEERVSASGRKQKFKIYADEPTLMTEAQYREDGNLAFGDDDAATKQRKMRQISQNNYDIVLMSEPTFQTLKLHPDKESKYLDDITMAGVGHISADAKDTHKKLEAIEKRRTAIANRSGDADDTITFEELGIDALFQDEAHHLKNLYGTKRSGDVAFLSQAESDRSLDFYYKARYIREQNNNQNTYLLTATPTTNNPLEAFNMLQHVCPEEFEKRGIQNVDDFLGMFGKIEKVMAPGVDGEITEKTGLVGFKNLRDLRHLFKKYARMQSVKDVNEQRKKENKPLMRVPEENNQDHFVEMTAAQKEVYADLKHRAQVVGNDGAKDHIFSIISDMDKAALDLGYYNEAGSGKSGMADIPEGEKPPKIAACADQVMSSRNANGGKQIIFCDAIQLHEDLKRQLVEAGYPEDEIAIVNAGTLPGTNDRQKISNAYNAGKITLVIGNTATMGEGMNFQIGTTDIHHLTTPWTPASIEQRNGRGVRQGNELDEVGCHYYHAKGSFDGYRKGVVERKRGWIDDLWRGDADEAENQNTGVLSMDEISLMMSDDPEEARRQLEANQELQMARHKEKMAGASLKQFGQVQTMKLALSKMTPEDRNSERGRALEARQRAATDALSRNEHFPHKDLLDGSTPAYVGTTGTVVKAGDYLKQTDGSVYRVDGVDLSAKKFNVSMVSGPDHAPGRIDAKSEPIDFSHVEAKQSNWNAVRPTSFDNAAHAERVMARVSSYSDLSKLDADTINANRDRLRGQLRLGQVPYLDPETNMVSEVSASELPDNAQVLWPHDGEAVEHLARTMAHPHADPEWRYHGIAQKLMGISWRGGAREQLRPKIETYREQHRAMAEQGPKEGDTRTNEAGHQEVLRNGRWTLVDKGGDAPAEVQNRGRFYRREDRDALKDALKDVVPANADLDKLARLVQTNMDPNTGEFDMSETQTNLMSDLKDLAQKGYFPSMTEEERSDTTQAIIDKISFGKKTQAKSGTAPAGSKLTGLGALPNEALPKEFEAKVENLFQYVRDSAEGERLIAKFKSNIPEDEIYADFAKLYRKYKALHRKTVGEDFFKRMDDLVNNHQDAVKGVLKDAMVPKGGTPAPRAKTPVAMAVDKHRAELEGVTRELLGRMLKIPYYAKLAEFGVDAVWDALQGNETPETPVAPAAGAKDLGSGKAFDTTGSHHEALGIVKAGILADPAIAASLVGPDKQNAEIAVKGEFDQQIRQIRRTHTEFYKEMVTSPQQKERLKQQVFDELWENAQNPAAGASPLQGNEAAKPPVAPAEVPSAKGHPDPSQGVRDALIALYEADSDGARKQNMTGFNGFHSPYDYDEMGNKHVKNEFVANLIERVQAGEELTPNQLAAALKIVSVYRKQLEKQHNVIIPTTEELKAQTGGGRSAAEFEGSMKLIDGEIHIQRPYNKQEVGKFQSIPGRRWDGPAKANIIPVESFKIALEKFPPSEFDIDPAIFEHPGIHKEPRTPDSSGVVRFKNGEYHVSFPYDRSMVARVKGITRGGRQLGKWNGADKTWKFPGDPQTLDLIMREFSGFDLQKSARRYTLAGVAYELCRLANNTVALCKAEVRHAV